MSEQQPGQPSEAAKAFRDAGIELCRCYLAKRPKWACAACSMQLFDEHCARQTERLREALENLVNQLDVVHADPQYQAVWTLAQLHGGPYQGPKYYGRLSVAKMVLAGKEDGRG